MIPIFPFLDPLVRPCAAEVVRHGLTPGKGPRRDPRFAVDLPA